MTKEKDLKTDRKEIISKRRYVRTTPDKVRLATSLIKNKKVSQALGILQFSNLEAAKPVILTLKSALAIAKDKDINEDSLYIRVIKIDEGPKLKRRRIIHQGRATAILKRMSHITVVLEEQRPTKIQSPKSKIKGASNGS